MKIDYSIFTKSRTIILTSFFSVLLVQLVVYFSPENQGWWKSPQFSWSNLFKFLFIDQILIECVSVVITFLLVKYYAKQLALNKVAISKKSILKYELSFLPVVFLAFFIFNPATQTLRFLYHYFPEFPWQEYWQDYFYSLNLYLTYLPLVFLQVYAALNINLLQHYSTRTGSSNSSSNDRHFIKVISNYGYKLVDQSDIIYCKKIKRKYYVFTIQNNYTTPYTISKLEKLLPSHSFIRVNRSTLLRLDKIEYYAFWENDKYIIRLDSGQEFTMSRQRLNKIKEKLKLKHN